MRGGETSLERRQVSDEAKITKSEWKNGLEKEQSRVTTRTGVSWTVSGVAITVKKPSRGVTCHALHPSGIKALFHYNYYYVDFFNKIILLCLTPFSVPQTGHIALLDCCPMRFFYFLALFCQSKLKFSKMSLKNILVFGPIYTVNFIYLPRPINKAKVLASAFDLPRHLSP